MSVQILRTFLERSVQKCGRHVQKKNNVCGPIARFCGSPEENHTGHEDVAGEKRFRTEKRRSDPSQLWIDRYGYSADDVYARFTVCACGRTINFVDRHAHMSKYCVIALWVRRATATTFGRFGTTRKAFLFLEKPNEHTATHVHHTHKCVPRTCRRTRGPLFSWLARVNGKLSETNENEKNEFLPK